MASNIGINAVISADDQASKVFKNFGNTMSRVGKVAGAAMIGAGAALTVFAKNSTDYLTNMVKDVKALSRETGISTKESSRLLYVTKRMGITADEASQMFGFFSKNIVRASKNLDEHAGKNKKLTLEMEKVRISIKDVTKQIAEEGDSSGKLTNKLQSLKEKLSELKTKVDEGTDAFSKLGIKVNDAHGKTKPFDQILGQVADRFKNMADGPKKTALAMELFGRSGKEMIKVLNLGSQGIEELRKNADKLGLTLTKDNIASVSAYVKSQKDLEDSVNGVRMAVGTLTAPVLTSLNAKISESINKFMALPGPIKTVAANVLAFGGPVLTAAGSVATFGSSVKELSPAFAGLLTKLVVIPAAILAVAVTGGMLAQKLNETQAKTGLLSSQSRTLMGTLIAILGPMGFFAAGLTTLATVLFGDTTQTNRLKSATDRLAAAQNAAKESSNRLKDAKLQMKGASLNVERAEKSLKDAVKSYGKNSLEAREATHNLKVAKGQLRDATDQAKNATKDHSQKLRDVKPAAKAAEEANAAVEQSAEGAESGFRGAASAVGSFISQLLGIPSEVNMPSGFKAGKAGGGGGGGGGGGFATGTAHAPGGIATVGEHGPERVVLPRGSQVVPHNSVKGSGGSTIININVPMFTGSAAERRQVARMLIKDIQDIAAMNGKTAAQMMDSKYGLAT